MTSQRYELSYWSEPGEVSAVIMADNDTTVLIVDYCWVVKLDAEGSVLWERDLGDCELTAASGADDGSIVIVGRQDDSPLALKMDANGSVEWRWEVSKRVKGFRPREVDKGRWAWMKGFLSQRVSVYRAL